MHEAPTTVYTNHGWWCVECTDHLFDIDEQTDRTQEWLCALGHYGQITLWYLGKGALALGGGIITLVLAVSWIAVCLFEGIESDTRKHEQDLKARDNLDRKDRDELTAIHAALLAERQRMLISIDQAKTTLGKPYTGGKNLNEADRDIYWADGNHNPPTEYTDTRLKLEVYLARLEEIEYDLNDVENRLKLHKMV